MVGTSPTMTEEACWSGSALEIGCRQPLDHDVVELDDTAVLPLREVEVGDAERLVLLLAEGLLVFLDDALDRAEVFERLLDLRPFGAAGLLDRGGDQHHR